MKYRILTPALRELADAAEYYESQVPGLGAEFLTEAETAFNRALDFPEAWCRMDEDFRHCNLRRFPYTVIYSIESADELLVVSVFHQHRKPLSWKRNI
jgi:toxin ParE2